MEILISCIISNNQLNNCRVVDAPDIIPPNEYQVYEGYLLPEEQGGVWLEDEDSSVWVPLYKKKETVIINGGF